MRIHHAALAAIAALAIACGGASRAKRGAATEPASANTTNAAPPGPKQHIENLMADVRRDSQALGTHDDSAPASPCAGGVQPTGPNGRPPRPLPRASSCSDVCRLKTRICENSDRICAIADEQLPGDKWARRQCDAAKGACSRAKDRCDKCDK